MPESNSRLLAAPMEVHQHILAFLPDIPSLAAAALSCRQLYAAVKNAESALVRRVLINCIGAANLPEALITHHSSMYPSLPKQQPCRAATPTDSPQNGRTAEWERIERVLYRFELFRKLFGRFHQSEGKLKPLAKSFFQKFAPWENAQLGCIHDFLAREVGQVYNYVAEHDIVWGAYRITLNGYGGYAIQHLPTLGLSKILEIARSETFGEKSRLVGGGAPIDRMNNAFLLIAFRSIYDIDHGNKKAAKAMRKLPPFFDDGDDGDNGPESTWRYTLEERVDYLVIEEEREENPYTLLNDRDTYDSFGTRFDLYELGLRGYWAPGDESFS
ncbi:hypothetical protein LRP88_00190 [Fusarium phalaenopsidis]